MLFWVNNRNNLKIVTCYFLMNCSLRCLSYFRIKNLFILKFIFDIYIERWNSWDVWHKLTDHSCVRLPLFFAVSYVILPEEIVWSEDWQFNFRQGTKWSRCTKNIMWKSINNTRASWLEVAIPFVNFWPNTKEAYETTLLEVDNVFAIVVSLVYYKYNLNSKSPS